MKDRKQLMHEINVASFTVDEAVLFLDTHPDDSKAMAYYQEWSEKRRDLVRTYEKQFGPLTNDSVADTDKFSWLDEPWPWEGGNC